MQVPKGNQDQGLRPAARSVAAPSPKPFRAASARPVAAALWPLAACLLAWLLLAGESRTAMTAAPWLVLVSWIASGIFPSMHSRTTSASVNPR